MEFHIFDYVLVSVLVLVLPVYGTWEHRRLMLDLDKGYPNARMNAYKITMIVEWTLSLIVIAWWIYKQRALPDLGLGFETGPGWKIGSALTLIACGLLVLQTVVIMRSSKKMEDVRKQIEPLQALLPHNGREARTFAALSITAGLCEELLYRGFLFAFFYSVLGVWQAVALSSLAFGLGHAYQGLPGILKTGGVGFVAAGLLLLTGSLWAPMLLHAVLDLNSGYLGHKVRSHLIAGLQAVKIYTGTCGTSLFVGAVPENLLKSFLRRVIHQSFDQVAFEIING
jgi:membrane protease YdiL (CAAX protease family)